jgi:hypothetical protein
MSSGIYQNPFLTDAQLRAAAELKAEVGWNEVRKGLGRILLGYGILIATTVLVVGLIVVVVVGEVTADQPKKSRLAEEVAVMIGAGILALACPFGYGCIAYGYWACLMSASERHGAKWLMFTCMTLLIACPVLNSVSWMTEVRRPPDFEHGLKGVQQVRFSERGGHMQVASAAAGLLSSLLFILFLRSTARCFDAQSCVLLVDFYLLFLALLLGGSVLLSLSPKLLFHPLVALAVAGVWGLGFLWYLVLIFCVRAAIRQGQRDLVTALGV